MTSPWWWADRGWVGGPRRAVGRQVRRPGPRWSGGEADEGAPYLAGAVGNEVSGHKSFPSPERRGDDGGDEGYLAGTVDRQVRDVCRRETECGYCLVFLSLCGGSGRLLFLFWDPLCTFSAHVCSCCLRPCVCSWLSIYYFCFHLRVSCTCF
jgi:hypothetical protein